MNVRCIITGSDASGKSVFVRDEEIPPITLNLLPGYEFHRVWGSDTGPVIPSASPASLPPSYFPPEHGFRFGFFTVPPDSTRMADNIDMLAALGELQSKLPGMAEVLEPDRPGMHTTDTVDFVVVISGEVSLELDDGAEVHLRAGDCVVQNGTRHAWHNRSMVNCVLAVCLLGAHRRR